MIPDKIRQKKRSFGVLKRILLIRARREGRMFGRSGMDIDIDRRAIWRMRMVAPDQNGSLASMEGEIPSFVRAAERTPFDSEPEEL